MPLHAGKTWFLAALTLLQHVAQPANAHGILTVPPARNWLAYINDKFDYADGLNSGGYKAVSQNGALKWPNGKSGICGDPAGGPQPFAKPGEVVATYKEGQVVEVHFLISTNHYGRIEVRLCPLTATHDSQCTKLQRADGRGEGWDLPAVAEGARFNGGALGDNLRPVEADPSYSWYPQPHVDCKWWKGCNRYDGLPVYKLRYKLPAGVTGRRMLLQWYYLSGHKCHPPCLVGTNCRSNPKYVGYLRTMDFCTQPTAAYPEEFANCADISIQ